MDTSQTLKTKIEALRKHASQLGDWDPTKEMRAWARENGKPQKLKAAEAFKVMILVEEKEEKKKKGKKKEKAKETKA